MSSSEVSAVSCTNSEYQVEVESDFDREASPPPPPSDDEATAFADDPLADAEWTAQYEQEIEMKRSWSKS